MKEAKGRATLDNQDPLNEGGEPRVAPKPPQGRPARAEKKMKSPVSQGRETARETSSDSDCGEYEAPEREYAPPDRDWVLARLREVAERCLQAVPPAGSAAEGGVWKFDAGGAIRALTLLGKHLGLFDDKAEQQPGAHEDALDELR